MEKNMNKTVEKVERRQYGNLTNGCGYDPSKLISKLQSLQKDYRINCLHKQKIKADVSSRNF
jgi:hypothetical protein